MRVPCREVLGDEDEEDVASPCPPLPVCGTEQTTDVDGAGQAMARPVDGQRRKAISVQHDGAATTCAAAAEADRKVELLGNEIVNPLEKRVADLEDLNLEQRVDTLFQRLRPYEDYRKLVDKQVQKLRQTEQFLKTRQEEVDVTVKTEVERQGTVVRELEEKVRRLQNRAGRDEDGNEGVAHPGDLAKLAARVQNLESGARNPSSADVNELAMDLLSRLQDGEEIHPAMARQIQLALPARRPSSIQGGSVKGGGSALTNSTSPPVGAVKKRRGRPPKHPRYDTKALLRETRRLIRNPPHRVSDASAASSASLSSAPTAGTTSSKASREVPETQPKETDVTMADEDGESEESDEPPFIPGERKSGRTPKPRTFEDQMNWKAASRVMQAMKPRAPGKGRR